MDSGTYWWPAVGGLGGMVLLFWWRVSHWRARLGRFPIDRRRTTRAMRAYRLHAEAERRAEQMLKELLTETEFQQLLRRGYLQVRSPSFPHRIYLVPERQGPVTVCEHGKPVMRLCVQCVERVPDYDTVAMHKLMIEGNEREYLRVANRV